MSTPTHQTDIAILKNDVERHERSLEKFELAIIKMGEATNSISRMLALHEERLSKSQIADKDITDLIEKRRVEIVEDVKKLHTRINETEHRITQVFEVGIDELKEYMIAERNERKKDKEELHQRISKLESWRMYILGILFGIGFVFAGVLKVLAVW